jgi:WhiB family redox-sensing transcriptional regulator
VKLTDAVPVPRSDWYDDAPCVEHTAVFYPGSGKQPVPPPWDRFCADCPVWSECLATALLTREQFGVWGGLQERERDRLSRRLTRGAVTWVQVCDGDMWGPAESVTPTG